MKSAVWISLLSILAAAACGGLIASGSGEVSGGTRAEGEGGVVDSTGRVAPDSDVGDAGMVVATEGDAFGASPPEAAPPPLDAARACAERGSIFSAGHCYFAVDTPLAFDDAKSECIKNGAHLIAIQNAGEQSIAGKLGSGERWIGLYAAPSSSPSREFAWVDGETLGYTNWESGEPNGSGNCVRTKSTGLWADWDCAVKLTSICERE